VLPSGYRSSDSFVQVESEGVIFVNKTHGAMIRFASAEDEDLKMVITALDKMILEISGKGVNTIDS